jgi:tRNA1(Val) A37 N6-methylase TrmN6
MNFDEFIEFAEDMATRYKFYRIIDNKIQVFLLGRDGMILYSEVEKPDNKLILDIVSKGFIETKLTNDEIRYMGLE